jgi:hypothetical protein
MNALIVALLLSAPQVTFPAGGGAPTDAPYVTTAAVTGLSAEVVLPTCTSTDKLTFNGTSISCAADVGGSYTLPAATATVLGGVKGTGTALVCTGTDKATGFDAAGALQCGADVGGSGAPTTAGYWTTIADAGLSAEVAMGTLASGLILNTATTGVPTIYGGASCTNQFPRALSASGAPTCAGIEVADFTANQGSTITVLHGNAAGQPSWGSIVAADLPTTTIAKGGTNLTTVAANQVWVGTAADTVAVKTLPSCSNATTSKLLFDNATQTFSCGTDQTSAGGPTMTRLTATWASSATANATGIVGTGGVPMTSPTYGASAPFSFDCVISTTRAATTNGPRYGVAASAGSVTRISYTGQIGLAATTRTETKLVAAMTTNCAANCTAAMTTGTLAQVEDDFIKGTGVMNASGTISLYMAPSAAAAQTAQIGSYCLWY